MLLRLSLQGTRSWILCECAPKLPLARLSEDRSKTFARKSTNLTSKGLIAFLDSYPEVFGFDPKNGPVFWIQTAFQRLRIDEVVYNKSLAPSVLCALFVSSPSVLELGLDEG